MSERFRSVAAALTLLALVAVPLHAQSVTEEIEVSILEIPVNVVDSSGDPVRGLDSSHFKVKVDGKAVPIRYFDVFDARSTVSTPAEAEGIHPAARRKFLLLFDMTASSPDNLLRATEAAQVFVNEVLEPQDLAAVATFSRQSGTRLLTGFTKSRSALELAIGTLGNPDHFSVRDPLMLSAGVTGTGIAPVESGGDIAPGEFRAIASQVAEEAAADYARQNRRVSDEHRKNQLRAQFQNLSSVGRLLDGVRGQKQVLFFSEGFDPRLITGSGTASQGQAEAAARGQIWNLDSDEIYGSSAVGKELEGMAQIFRRSDVVLHAIDIEGIRMNAGRSDFTASTDESLYLLSNPTGGTVFKNTNQLENSLAQAAQLHEVVYVLGVTPPRGGARGDWRPIEVSVDRDGARTIYKPGYYVKTGQQDPFEMFTSMTERLTGPGGYNAYDVRVTGIPLPSTDGAAVQTVVEIEGDDLLREGDGSDVAADVFVYAFTPEGDVAGFFHQSVSVDGARAPGNFANAGVRVYGNLNLRPGTYDLRTLVRSKVTGETGVEQTRIVVPEKPGVTDPLFFADQTDWVWLQNQSVQNYPFTIREQMFVPTSTAKTDKSASIPFVLYTWDLSPEQLALDFAVLDESGNETRVPIQLLGRSSPDESGEMMLLLEMDPSQLAAGDYTIRVGVRDASGQPQWGSGRLIVQ